MDKIKLLQFFYNTLLPAIDNLAELKIALLFLRISVYLKRLIHRVPLFKIVGLSGLTSEQVKEGLLSAQKRRWLSFADADLNSGDQPIAFRINFTDQINKDQLFDVDNNIYINQQSEFDMLRESLKKELKSLGLTPSYVKKALDEKTPAYLQEKIELLKKLQQKESFVMINPAGFLRKAIEEDYKLFEKGEQKELFTPQPAALVKSKTPAPAQASPSVKNSALAALKARLSAPEKDQLLKEAKDKLRKDLGPKKRIPQGALEGYLDMLLEERYLRPSQTLLNAKAG